MVTCKIGAGRTGRPTIMWNHLDAPRSQVTPTHSCSMPHINKAAGVPAVDGGARQLTVWWHIASERRCTRRQHKLAQGAVQGLGA